MSGLVESTWLWLVVHTGTRQATPREFRRFWLLMSVFWFCASALGVAGAVAGDDYAGVFLAITLIMFAVSVAFTAIAAADLSTPRTIEGRVTAKRTVAGKGTRTDATGLTRRYAEEHGYYSHRVTIEDSAGVSRTFRGSVGGLSDVSEGDAVRASVGVRLRWIYRIDPLEHPGGGTPR